MKAKFISILFLFRITRLSALFSLMLVTVATLFSVTCSRAEYTLAETDSGRTVRAGIFNFKPLVIFDQKSPPTGFIVDILNHILPARRQNRVMEESETIKFFRFY